MLVPNVLNQFSDLTYTTFCYIHSCGYNFTEFFRDLRGELKTEPYAFICFVIVFTVISLTKSRRKDQ